MNTETKSLAAKITPGEARIIDGDFLYILNEDGSNRIHFSITKGWASEWKGGGIRTTQEEVNANATLYAEAHNVANECGMTPRQLLERLTKCAWELEKARQELVSCKHYLPPNGMELVDDRITRIELFLSSLTLPADEH